MVRVRPRARSIHILLLSVAGLGCHKEPVQAPVVDEACSGAGCVEQAEAALYYKDYDKAREPLGTVCDNGDGFACFRLAELHQHGRGGPTDLVRAAALYEDSCGKKYPEGCERRFGLAQDGQGDPQVELDYALRACEGGRPLGCMHAAEQLKSGRGAEPDPLRVIQTFQKACALGEITGCVGAGDLLSDPERPAEDRVNGLTAYIKACVGHSGYGCLKVGVAFHDGVGAPQDLTKAAAHFTRACDYSETDGCRAAEQLAASNGQPITLQLTTRAAELERDGLAAREVGCRLPEQGLPALADAMSYVARHKSPLDACAPEGAALRITWAFEKGRISDVKVTDPVAKKVGWCVATALKKARMPGNGSCEAVLLLGDPANAATAFTARVDKQKAKGDGRKHIRIGADSE